MHQHRAQSQRQQNQSLLPRSMQIRRVDYHPTFSILINSKRFPGLSLERSRKSLPGKLPVASSACFANEPGERSKPFGIHLELN